MGVHLVLRQHRAGLVLERRVPDPRGEVPDDQDGDVAEVLEGAELPEDHGPSEGDVVGRGIEAEFDAQRTSRGELLAQLVGGLDPLGVPREDLPLLGWGRGRHGSYS